MDTITMSLVGIAALLVWVAWRVMRLDAAVGRAATESPGSMELLQREVHAVRAGLDGWLQEHLHHTRELSQRLGRLQSAAENMEQLGAEIAELQQVLGPPQLRGALGERMLEDLLADVLPREAFRMQHRYPGTGVRVDAAVLVGDGRVLPIDSKFPLDNFRRCIALRGQDDESEAAAARRAFARDVRRHVDDIAERYLSPDDGALDVAFMYIPSEAVFHEIMLWESDPEGVSLAEYTHRRRVIPASPNTLHAYLCVVRMGLRGFRLQENAREILRQLGQLHKDVEGVRSELGTAITQARHSLSNLDEAERGLRRVEERLAGVSRLRQG